MSRSSRRSRGRRQEAATSTAPAVDAAEHIYRGFGPNAELINEGGKNAAITREDVLEVPAIDSANPFLPPNVDGGTGLGLIDNTQGNTPDQLRVAESVTVESSANLLLEYIASAGPRVALQFGAPFGLSQGVGIHVLPLYIDELERDFGTDMYLRMMNDAVVQAKVETFKDGILDKPLTISPGIEAEGDDESGADKKRRKFATEVADFVQANMDELPQGIMLVLREMLDAIPLGYKLAEQVYELRGTDGKYPNIKGKATMLASLNPKPQEAVNMVADQFNTVLGYIPRLRGAGLLGSFLYGDLGVRTAEDQAAGKANIPDLIPPEKVARFSWMPRNDDPRGISHLRPAYIPWRLKIGLYPAYEAYLARFAQPSVVIELLGREISALTSTNGTPITDPTAIITLLLTHLRNWQAGGALVLPEGNAKMVQAIGDGKAYLSAFELVDEQITVCILHNDLSTGVGKYGTKGLGEVHQDTGNLLYDVGKLATANFVRNQIVRPLVYYNYGEAGLAVLPFVTFGETTAADATNEGGMVAQLKTADLIFPPQYNDIYKMLHLKELDADVVQLLIDVWKKGLEQQASMMDQQAAGGLGMMPGQQPGMAGAAPGGPQKPGAPGAGVPGKPGAGAGSTSPQGGAGGKQAQQPQPQPYYN